MEEKAKNRDKQILDYEAEIESLKKEITQNELNLQNNQIQQDAYHNILQKFSNHAVIYAASSGKLMDFDLKKGQKISDNFFVGRIGLGNKYEIKCELSLDNNFVVVGDTCKVKNANHSFTGTVSKITLSEKAKNITISLESDEISSGETFDVTFEKDSKESYILVPNGALNIDSDGYYLYQIKRRDGMIGQEFYTQKLRVYIGDNDDNNTAITKGISYFEPIVLSSDKSFTEGQAINLNNVGDFFEE